MEPNLESVDPIVIANALSDGTLDVVKQEVEKIASYEEILDLEYPMRLTHEDTDRLISRIRTSQVLRRFAPSRESLEYVLGLGLKSAGYSPSGEGFVRRQFVRFTGPPDVGEETIASFLPNTDYFIFYRHGVFNLFLGGDQSYAAVDIYQPIQQSAEMMMEALGFDRAS